MFVFSSQNHRTLNNAAPANSAAPTKAATPRVFAALSLLSSFSDDEASLLGSRVGVALAPAEEVPVSDEEVVDVALAVGRVFRVRVEVGGEASSMKGLMMHSSRSLLLMYLPLAPFEGVRVRT